MPTNDKPSHPASQNSDLTQAKRLSRLFSSHAKSKDQEAAKQEVDNLVNFVDLCKKGTKLDPGDVAKILAQTSNSLIKLSNLELFKNPANKELLVEFARELYKTITSSLQAKYAINRQFQPEVSRLKATISTISETPKLTYGKKI